MTFGRFMPKWRHDLYHAALLCGARRRPQRLMLELSFGQRPGSVKLRCAGQAAAQAVRPASTTQSTCVLRLRIEPGVRFAHQPVSILAAISAASQAKTACLTALIVSRPDRRLPRAPTLHRSFKIRIGLQGLTHKSSPTATKYMVGIQRPALPVAGRVPLTMEWARSDPGLFLYKQKPAEAGCII